MKPGDIYQWEITKITCIIALKQGREMHMAGDGRVSDDCYYMSTSSPKVFRRKNYLIGMAGDGIACDLVEAARLPDYTDKSANTRMWVLRELVPAIRAAFKQANYVVNTEGSEDNENDFGAIVMVNGDMFELDEVLSPTGPLLSPFHAVGSGGPYAIGVLAATDRKSVV